jgi:hypothetical protein
MIGVYHTPGGASDVALLGEVEPASVWTDLRTRVRRLLQLRGKTGALAVLDSMDFHLHRGTNHFNDDFHVLHAKVPAREYVKYESVKYQERDVDTFGLIATTAGELSGFIVRHVALDLDESTLTEPATVPAPKLAFTNEVVEQALHDAEILLAQSGPANAIDRAHTAIHGYVKHVCSEAHIEFPPDASIGKGLAALRRQHPAFAAPLAREDAINKAIRALANIADSLNDIRNNATLAHPNEVLEKPEAMLMINSARTLLHYVDSRLRAQPLATETKDPAAARPAS